MTVWPVKTLGEVVRFDSETARPEDLSSRDVYVGLENIASDGTLIGLGNVSADTLKSNKARFTDNHILFGKLRPYLVKVVRPDFSGVCSTDILPINPSAELSRDFLYWYMRSPSLIEYATEASTGTTLPRVSPKTLKSFKIAVPPLEEQKRIVALLDAASARVSKLIACYEQARTHAELLSGSLLVELLTGVVDSEPMKLGDIAELRGRIGWRGLTAKEYTKEGPLFMSVHSLNYGHFVDFKDAFHISQERYDESPEIMLRNHDILICKDGAGIGKLGIVDHLPGQATINSSLLLIRAGKKVRSEFLYFYLLSPIFQNLVQERLSGSTTPHLYQRDIAELIIKLPSLESQDHLIERMWSALGRQGDLVKCFNGQVEAMKQMRQSILDSAFAGDL